jgi:hypothetical protein
MFYQFRGVQVRFLQVPPKCHHLHLLILVVKYLTQNTNYETCHYESEVSYSHGCEYEV